MHIVPPVAGSPQCWACGRPDGKEHFQRCGLCLKDKLSPAVFCSIECQVAAWPRHKEWHKHRDAIKAHSMVHESDNETSQANVKLIESRAGSKEVAKLLSHAHLLLEQDDDLNAAVKSLKRAVCAPEES